MSAQPAFVDLSPASGVVVPGGWEPLATLADERTDGRIHVTGAGRIRLYGPSLLDVPGFTPGVGPAPAGEIGWLDKPEGRVHLGVALHLGMMTSHIARMLDVIEAPVRVCRDGILQIEDLSEGIAEQVVRVLAPLGLIFDAGSALRHVSVCGNCALSRSDVYGDARQLTSVDGPTHVAGCGHTCGAPTGSHVTYLAIGDGEYDVT